MLRCIDGSLYTGFTNNVECRVSQHESGLNPECYTYHRRPVELVYSADFTDVWQAIAWEKTVKRWSRKKKEALILNDSDELFRLARNGMSRRIRRIRESTRGRVMVRLCSP